MLQRAMGPGERPLTSLMSGARASSNRDASVISLGLSRFDRLSAAGGTGFALRLPMQAERPFLHEARTPKLPAVDTRQRFVRVLEERADGMVFFEFAIGWPDLAVELLLPAPAFEAFCLANGVQRLDA